jgi:hypothetical protein
MIQAAWRFVRFQKNSALAQWFAARTTDGRAGTRKTMIVALDGWQPTSAAADKSEVAVPDVKPMASMPL